MIIGGASLLGSHLCERLLLGGDDVIVVDDFTSGSFATLSHLKGQPGFSFVEHDMRAQLSSRKLDAIVHLALPSSRRAYESDPVRSTVTSVVGTAHALELAADHDARLVVATSPERWGQGVRCAESLVVEFTRARKVDVRMVRVASPYGPRMPADDPHVVMRFIREAMRGGSLTFDVDSTHRVSFVDDAVDTMMRTLNADLRVPAVAVPSLDVTTSVVAHAVLDATSRSDVTLVSSSEPPGSGNGLPPSVPVSMPLSMRLTTPEALPATIVFGQPQATSLAEGVRQTMRWFESRCASLTAAPRTSGIFGLRPAVPGTGTDTKTGT